jgi:DNA repair protein RecN (Recombination protein N)
MLHSLRIENLALIDNLYVEFGDGLNVITGPTGAGKSIIIGGLEFVLGGRASSVMLRTGELAALVEAQFRTIHSDTLRSLLESAGAELQDDLLTLRREYRKKGTGRTSVNDTPVPVSFLKRSGGQLVSILGQHSHQTLLDQSTHCGYLDEYAGLGGSLPELKKIYNSAVDLKERIEHAERNAVEISGRIELLKFQIDEIGKAGLRPGEEEELKSEKIVLENALRIREAGEMAAGTLLESDDSILEKLGEIEKNLRGIPAAGDVYQNIIASMNGASDLLNEAVREIRGLVDRAEDDPERLEQINERLHVISRLKRKYDGDIGVILKYADDSRKKLDDLTDRVMNTEKLEKEFADTLSKLNRLSTIISESRKKARAGLEKSVGKNLESMGMEKAQFVVDINAVESADGLYCPDGRKLAGDSCGYDMVEFMFCANPGEGLKPLARVASGGEISRVMLALKNSILKSTSSGCEVFDEIDVGISGEVATRVAGQLKELSRKHQVICITHLQQIASAADHHYRVYKPKIGGRSVTRIEKLGPKERVREIATLLSGAEVTDTALAGAREMLKNSRPRR